MLPHVKTTTTDLCMHGKPWRKRTTSMCANLGLGGLNNYRCYGAKLSGRPHVVLKGTDRHGRFLTKVVEPYPKLFCSIVASCYVVATRRQRFSALWRYVASRPVYTFDRASDYGAGRVPV